MNTKKKTLKSILCCTTAFSALTVAGIGAIKINNPAHEVYATGVGSVPVSIANSNFNADTRTSYPYNPSSFTAYNQTAQADSTNNDANITAGVINLSNENYATKFSLAKRNFIDDYVLMIDSTKEEDGVTTMHNAKYGFRSTSTTTLEANSKYMITVDVFTSTNSNIASLYLFDGNGEVFSSIEKVNSYNTWTTYTFFVATNNMESVDVKIGMYLDGAGIVLFDNISAFKLSDNDYALSKNTSIDGTFIEENKVDNIENIFNVNQDRFENIKNSSDHSSITNSIFDFDKISVMSTVKDSDGKNSNALLINNVDSTYNQFETEDDFLEFQQNKIYKVSISVKTKDLNGTAYLKLIRTDIDEDDQNYNTEQNKTIKITSNTASSENNVTNDYKTYSFLVKSHPSKLVSYKFAFGLGEDSSSATKGQMYISQIEISRIDYDTFNSATTGSGTEKIDFVDAYANSKIMLNNGDFNAFKIADYNSPMPATPVDWTVGLGSNLQKHGIVNTQTFNYDLNASEFSNLRNPYSTETNQNVLMMYNEKADTLSYTSTSKTLESQSYHKFEVSVQTQNAPIKISLVTKKDDKEIELVSKTVNTEYQWENITLFIHTAYQSLDVSLKLTLETSGYGYAYIDDAKFDYILTSSQLENEFNTAENSSSTAVVDLTNMLSSNTDENFAKTTLFLTSKVSGVESGIISLNGSHLNEIIYDSNNFETFKSVNGDNVLGIRATDDVFYSATSNLGFKLNSSSAYYKISVDVYTQNLSSNDSSIDPSKLGASIKLSGFEDTFTSIKSNNEWTTYSFYIQSKDLTTYLELSLGSEDAKTKGDVFFGNIQFFDNITEREYNLAVTNEFVKVIKLETTENEDKTDKESTTKDSKSSNINWIYIIPSLVTVAAVLIAVVGLVLRKIKFKKPVKKSKNVYDRNKTVSVQYYTRKATTLREEKLRELNSDLEKINSQRAQYEETYKQSLTELRQMKIKRANPQEIAKLEKELKKNQKLSASLGVTANKISAELEYTKTEAFLNSLIRKLQREQSEETKNTTK